MSTKTTNIDLVLMDTGEMDGQYGEVLNDNFETIDEHVGDIENELSEARGTTEGLLDRINQVTEDDGTPILHPDLVEAEQSMIHDVTDNDFRLGAQSKSSFFQRMGFLDYEAWTGHAGSDSLQNALGMVAMLATGPGRLIKAASSTLAAVGGYANRVYLRPPSTEHTLVLCGSKLVKIEGISSEVDARFYCEMPVATAATYILYIQPPASLSLARITRRTNGAGSGVTVSSATDFTLDATDYAAAGDLLVITVGNNAGQYVIDTFAAGAGTILGAFVEVDAVARSYEVVNPYGHGSIGYLNKLAYDNDPTLLPADAAILGEFYADGAGTVSGRVDYSGLQRYEACYTGADVAKFKDATISINHNFGCIPAHIEVYAKLTSTETEWTKVPLSAVSNISSVTITDTKTWSPSPVGIQGLSGASTFTATTPTGTEASAIKAASTPALSLTSVGSVAAALDNSLLVGVEAKATPTTVTFRAADRSGSSEKLFRTFTGTLVGFDATVVVRVILRR